MLATRGPGLCVPPSSSPSSPELPGVVADDPDFDQRLAGWWRELGGGHLRGWLQGEEEEWFYDRPLGGVFFGFTLTTQIHTRERGSINHINDVRL